MQRMASTVSQGNEVFLQQQVEKYLKQSFPENVGHFEKLLQVLTRPPFFTTVRTISKNASKCIALLQAEFSKQCHALQWDPFELFPHPELQDCVIVRNRGPYVLEKLDKEIMVDVQCGMAILRGANVFKRGILAAPQGLRKEDKVAVYADLDGKCLKGTTSKYQGRKLHIGNGISQVSREDVFNTKDDQNGVGIWMVEPLYQAPSLSDLELAIFYPQNLPSVVCSHVLGPQPGEIILDMCAAPGGKSIHIASLMGEQGRLIALEKSGQRASRMQEMLDQIDGHIVEIYTFDSTKATSPEADMSGGPPYPQGMFDRILLDAPCSALGQRPCLANHISLKQLQSYPVVQRKLLMTAVQLLKPGGVLVYSTCTLPREENEDQVCYVLKSCPDMELVQIQFTSSAGGLASSQLSPAERSKVLRFDPANTKAKIDPWDIDTIGFFIAKFEKRKSGLS